MIADLLGIMALLLISVSVLMFALKWPSVANILWVAFIVRAAAALFHYYILPLPDSDADAATFEQLAWEWAQSGFGEVWSNFTGPDPYLISWIIALIYSITDRSLLLAQSLTVFTGTCTVLLGWLLVRDLWGEYVASKVGWIFAFFPTLVLYSAIPLRETFIWFFLVLGLLGAARMVRNGGFISFFLATLGFVGASFFHGAMIVGMLVFAGVVLLRSLKSLLLGLKYLKLNVLSIALVSVMLVPVGGFLTDTVYFPYLGNFSRVSDLEAMVTRVGYYTRPSDAAAYSAWVVPSSPVELLYKGPIRIVHFVFSPFPWDIKSTSHFLGLFDGFLYGILTFFMWCNRKSIWADPAARLLFIILLAYLVVFGMAVGNFGTGIRHRAKFVVIFIALAAPCLPKVKFLNSAIKI